MPDPSDYDDMDEFIDDCVDERLTDDPDEDDDTAAAACQLIWEDSLAERSGGKTVVRKTHASKADGLDFVLSDETADRYGDVIAADGWELSNFKRNPIALFGHNSSFPIGNWKDLHVENGALRGHLQLAPAGTSERIDELRKLVEAGILRAVSVGFLPLKKEKMNEHADEYFGPFKYLKQELIETSLVSIPANPNALSVAKGLKVSDDTLQMVFGKHADRNITRSVRRNGKHAETSRNRKFRNMSTLAQRIKDAEKHLVDARDKLTAHLDQSDDSNVTDADLEMRQMLNGEIVKSERTLASLKESEKHLGQTSDDGNRSLITAAAAERANNSTALSSARPFSVAQKKLTPMDLFIRAGAAQVVAHRDRRSVDEVRRMAYGDDEATRAVLEWQMRAATAPAMSNVAGWAAELVQQIVVDFMATLYPKAIYPRFSALGLSLTFGRNGKVIIPTRSRTPTIAGSFVGEGLPIPVRQGAFTSQSLTPKKMAVITTWTREIDEHSIPAIEGLLRDAIQTDTAISLDSRADRRQPGNRGAAGRHPQRRCGPDPDRRRRL